jgi:transporter family protein
MLGIVPAFHPNLPTLRLDKLLIYAFVKQNKFYIKTMQYSWLIYALLSAVFAALVAVFGKIGLKNFDSNVATTIRAIIMAIFLFVIIVFQGKFNQIHTIFSNNKAFLFIIFSGIAGALSWLFYFLALKRGTISQITPIDRLSIVFAILIALVFLGEKISFIQGVGILITIIGAALITLG